MRGEGGRSVRAAPLDALRPLDRLARAGVRAEIYTSAPVPEPRSKTISPGYRPATAVGILQPSEAAAAPSAMSAV